MTAVEPVTAAGGTPPEPVLADVRDLPPPARYDITLPAGWVSLDPRPSRSARSIRHLVEDRIRRFPELAPHRQKLLQVLRAVVNQAVQHRAQRLAMLSEPVDEHVIAASLVVFAVPGVPLDSVAVTNHPTDVAAHLRAAVPAGQIEDGTRTVDVVALVQQAAVRVECRTELVDGRTGVRAETAAVQYYVPIPGGEDLLILAFSTPCLSLREPLTAVFDVMAATFYWSW